jgi:DNA-binding NtrC family response regulator
MGRKKTKTKHHGSRPAEKGFLDQMLEELEYSLITKSLERNQGSIRATAIELGCTRVGLSKRMDRLGIDIQAFRAAS